MYENEIKNYIIFVLGYDFLHDKFIDSNDSECDIVYNECEKIADDFIKSEFYSDYSKGVYDALVSYLKAKQII